MRFVTMILAIGMVSAGLFAMNEGYSHPGSLAQAAETQNVFGAECYMPSQNDVWICSGGLPPSNCSGCGCQLWSFANIVPSGGGTLKKKTCYLDPTCQFDDVDVSRFCNGTSKDTGGDGGTVGF